MSEKMKAIIAEQLSVNAEEIKPETNFKEDLGVDSLGSVRDGYGNGGRVRS